MFIVLKRKQVKHHLCIALALILVGMALSNPFQVKAESNIVYLYPYLSNNPVEQSGLFWLESNPEWGAYPLNQWGKFFPDKRIVIGLPEQQFTLGASMSSDNLGRYIVHKIKKQFTKKETKSSGKSDKDIFSYKRTVNNVTEEIKVEIGKHFENNDNWKQFMEIVKNNLTNDELIKPPTPEPTTNNNNDTTQMLGNTMVLGGIALALRILIVMAAL